MCKGASRLRGALYRAFNGSGAGQPRISKTQPTSTIAEVTVPSEAFELGRILRVEGQTQITLETMVPLGGGSTLFVRIRNDARESFRRSVRDHSAVERIQAVNSHENETLYALEWKLSEGSLLETIIELEAVLLNATGTADAWKFELRFPAHEALSEFQAYSVEEGLPLRIERIYSPTSPEAGPWYGLTGPQNETLTSAVENGYYSLPREISTQELAETFDISDQAVTERLRRGLSTLVENTLLVDDRRD